MVPCTRLLASEETNRPSILGREEKPRVAHGHLSRRVGRALPSRGLHNKMDSPGPTWFSRCLI